jgi:tRNA pseudouridine32 synthase/23S rRNA pseudouridine746 synthase
MAAGAANKKPAPLPVRDGVGPSLVWLQEGSWPNMLAFLVAHFPYIEAATWIARMERAEVVDQEGIGIAPDTPYRRGRCIYYYREIETETVIPFAEKILYQDAHLLVADKPHFLPVTPSGRFLQQTLLVRLKKSTGLMHLTPIHRLDRETAGVVIFSHDPSTRGAYQSLFQKRAMHKVYHALAPSSDALSFPLTRHSCIVKGDPFFRMHEIDAAANAETRIELLERRGDLSLYELHPVTGRQHQLRVHMSALGLPIVNDAFYPEALPNKLDDVSAPLQLLAKEIAFDDPLTGAHRSFASRQKISFPDA